MQVPYQHRINKKLLSEIIKKTFPMVASVPIASRDNDISWNSVFRQNVNIQNYIKSVLVEKENSFDEYLDKRRLLVFLDQYFKSKARGNDSFNTRIFQRIKTELKEYKFLVNMVRKIRPPWVTEDNIVIFRIMILKIWFDLFVDNNSY